MTQQEKFDLVAAALKNVYWITEPIGWLGYKVLDNDPLLIELGFDEHTELVNGQKFINVSVLIECLEDYTIMQDDLS